MQIAIIQYNAGNVHSVANALRRLGAMPRLTDDPDEIRQADRVVFPGVGEASAAMRHLREKGLDVLIRSLRQPVLGICLGMQLLGSRSEEQDTPCLGILDAAVRRLRPQRPQDGTGEVVKVPHVGWNSAVFPAHPLFDGIPSPSYFYFVHGYAMEPVAGATLAVTTHGQAFSSAVQQGNFFGVQFHPEKSAEHGARLLRNFLSDNILSAL
jgi:glutamine amidotransferase